MITGKAGMVTYRRLLVISIIAMLVFPMLGVKWHNLALQERTQPVAKPTKLWDGFIKRGWPPFWEQRFLGHIGSVRSLLVLSYNETIHRLFPTRPNNSYIWAPEIGYYPVDTIRRLNSDELRRDTIRQHYQNAAHRLRILQELLGHHGVALLLVTPPPKIRVYPEYAAPYLISSPETIMSRAVSYGDILEESGVNVLNVQRIFSERKAASPWPFFTTTSFHWSFWAGCTVAGDIMRKAEDLTGRPFFPIGCSAVDYGRSKWADTDIASILNIFSTTAIIGEAPFPKITPQQNPRGESHKIVVIGDSFSDQIVYALAQALPDTSWSPGWLTRYDSFISRQTIGMEGKVTAKTPLQQDGALSEILTKELVIMEVSDGNVHRDAAGLDSMEFGATRALLDGLLPKDTRVIDPKNFLVDGWRILGKQQWRTTGHQASFAIRPPDYGNRIQLMLDVENLASDQSNSRFLTILLDGKSIGQATLARGRGMLELTIPTTAQWQDRLVAEISLRDASGQPLDLLLHGVTKFDSDTDKAANKAIASKAMPTAQIVNHAGMKTINLISREESEDILVDGLSGLESNGRESWRWALGPATRIKFHIDPSWPDQARQLPLKFAFKNGVTIPGQTVTMRLNGEDIRRFSAEEVGVQKLINADMMLTAKKGVNVLEIVYQDWNHGKNNYGNDPRKLAVVVMQLSLQVGK